MIKVIIFCLMFDTGPDVCMTEVDLIRFNKENPKAVYSVRVEERYVKGV